MGSGLVQRGLGSGDCRVAGKLSAAICENLGFLALMETETTEARWLHLHLPPRP